jgi:hypothetical protein
MTPLNRTVLNVLTAFHEAGGTGALDIHGRVLAGQPVAPMPGDLNAWLKLVARGYVAGERDFILITEEGRVEAERLIAGLTRTGA